MRRCDGRGAAACTVVEVWRNTSLAASHVAVRVERFAAGLHRASLAGIQIVFVARADRVLTAT